MMPVAERCFLFGTARWFSVGVEDPEPRVLYDGPDRASADEIADWYGQRYGWRPLVRTTGLPSPDEDL